MEIFVYKVSVKLIYVRKKALFFCLRGRISTALYIWGSYQDSITLITL